MIIWAPSSEFVSSSIPPWQISTAHVQPFRGARDLVFCLKVPLDSLLVWASSEGSGETARMRRLAWTFAARIGDKYQIRLTRSIYRANYLQLKSVPLNATEIDNHFFLCKTLKPVKRQCDNSLRTGFIMFVIRGFLERVQNPRTVVNTIMFVRRWRDLYTRNYFCYRGIMVGLETN